MKTLLLLSLTVALAAAIDYRGNYRDNYNYPVPIVIPANPIYSGGYQPNVRAPQNYGHGGYHPRDDYRDAETRAQVRGLLRLLTDAGVDALVNVVFAGKHNYHHKK